MGIINLNEMTMDFDEVLDAIEMESETGLIMAKLICSTYWGEPCNLKTLSHLDSFTFAIALSVMGYRRETGWNNDKFYNLAMHAKHRIAPSVKLGNIAA